MVEGGTARPRRMDEPPVERAAISDTADGELPAGWTRIRLSEIADVALGKMLDRAKRTRGTKLPYLRNASVRWNGFDLSSLLEMPFEDDELERYELRAGDLLVCEGGEP